MLKDASIVARRQLRMNLRNPLWIILGLAQPLLYLFLFGPLLQPLVDSFGAHNAYTFFVPGLLIQLGIFGALFNGFGLIAEWREGVVEAERVTPASRVGLLIGRVARDLLLLTVQALLLVGLGYTMGMEAPLSGVATGVALTLALGATGACLSHALALTTKSEDALAPITNGISMPVLLLSGILLPMALAPGWLQRLSDLMPIKHVVDAARQGFTGDATWATTWVGVACAAVLLVLSAWWATRRFPGRRRLRLPARAQPSKPWYCMTCLIRV